VENFLAPERTGTNGSFDERWAADILPPFPAVALRALNIMGGTDTCLLDLCDLIRADPAFSTAVLRLANSPLIGFRKQITSVLQASMLLGFRRLKSVAITIGLKAYLENHYAPTLQACWHHCLATAIVAELAAPSVSLDKDFAYTAGILHDVGRIAMAVSMPHCYARVLDIEVSQPEDLLRIEREICGIDHCKAGLALVKTWGLPSIFVEVTSCHHNGDDEVAGVVSLVRPSCMLADALGFSVVQYRALRSYEAIIAEFPGTARSGLPADAKELTTIVRNTIRVIEST
jgi:putative nucleotidyltransferase with HDIG domain